MSNSRFWMPEEKMTRQEAKEEWKTCPVTIAAGALITEDQLEELEHWVARKNRDSTIILNDSFKVIKPDENHECYPLWNGIGKFQFSAWVDKTVTANIHMGKEFDMGAGYEMSYWTGEFGMFHYRPGENPKQVKFPETMVTGVAGSPMTGLLKHPIFHGLNWNDEQEYEKSNLPSWYAAMQKTNPVPSQDGYYKIKGPNPDIPLGTHPGARLVGYIRAKRDEVRSLLAAYQAE